MTTNITMLVANRPRLTKQALDSIGDLSDATVTIRDAGMNTEVFDAVNKWTLSIPTVRLGYSICPDPLGTGPARNQVIEFSEKQFGRGNYLYISDEDVFYKRHDWLSILIKSYEESWKYRYRMIGAYNHPYNGPIAGEQWVKSGEYAVYPVYALASQSILMRWSVFDEFGPFCQTPAGKVCQSEDVDLSNKIRAAGYKVGVISPALLVNTGITNSFGEKIVGWEMVAKEAPQGVVIE